MRLATGVLIFLARVSALVTPRHPELVSERDDRSSVASSNADLRPRAAGWTVTLQGDLGAIRPGAELSVTSRNPDAMDLFYFRGNNAGAPLTQECWNQGEGWKTCRTFQYTFNYVTSRGPVTAYSRRSDRHEVFFVDAESTGISLFRWRHDGGWWSGTPSVGHNVATNTNFGVVSRGSDSLEVFWARNDKALMHAYTFDDGNSWERDLVLDFDADVSPGSIAVMSKDANSQVVTWVTNQGALMLANYAGGSWRTARILNAGSAPVSTKLAALARSDTRMNIFFVGTNSRVWQAYWRVDFGDNVWAISQVSDLPAAVGGISAVSMNRDHMEVFWTSTDGTIMHAYWTLAANAWRSEALPGSSGATQCTPGSSITVVARKGKSTIEGWCRSKSGQAVHFYYYAS